MEDCPSTKGLLLKGLKTMSTNSQSVDNEKPVAHGLWKNDCMAAFT